MKKIYIVSKKKNYFALMFKKTETEKYMKPGRFIFWCFFPASDKG